VMACEKADESLHHAERNCKRQTDNSLPDEGGERLRPGRIAMPDNSVLYLPVSTFVGTGFFIHPL
ncbi:hypothetical protein ACQ9A1_27235, partial [Escherichia coli]|uniref:hypothetical protein n=1 Tax=Escherichia coli TaxID=562 RepID=UPI003D367855